MKYTIDKELEGLPAVEQVEYKKQEIALRKDARAMLADLDSKTFSTNDKRRTMGAIARFYGTDEYDKIYSSMMRSFVGKHMYYNFVEPHMEKERRYKTAVTKAKKLGVECTIENPRSVRDYFDIPTLYHFYKYQKVVKSELKRLMQTTKSSTMGDYLQKLVRGSETDRSVLVKEIDVKLDNVEKTVTYDMSNVDDFFLYCATLYQSMDKTKNMAFNTVTDIKFLKDPIKDYKTISSRQKILIAGKDKSGKPKGIGQAEITKQTNEPLVKWGIQENLFEYMFTRAIAEGRFNSFEIDLIREGHLKDAVELMVSSGIISKEALPTIINKYYGEKGLAVLERIKSKAVEKPSTLYKNETLGQSSINVDSLEKATKNSATSIDNENESDGDFDTIGGENSIDIDADELDYVKGSEDGSEKQEDRLHRKEGNLQNSIWHDKNGTKIKMTSDGQVGIAEIVDGKGK